MADLIPFVTRQLGKESVNTVNARDLHAYLGIGRDCPTWVRAQIKRAHLRDNMDYIVFPISGENSSMGRPQLEYHLTFDAAKHVAMMSNSAKGHEVRAWFIAKEKELAQLSHHPSALERFPELRAIVELVQSTAEARLLAEEAKRDAAQANANATRALDSQQYLTVAEYVYINRLQHQLPQSAYKACSDHLRLYCLDRNIPTRRIPVGDKRWNEEIGFHVSVWAEAFPGWLLRRNSQSALDEFHTNDWDPRDA